jgi:hypothetical protein
VSLGRPGAGPGGGTMQYITNIKQLKIGDRVQATVYSWAPTDIIFEVTGFGNNIANLQPNTEFISAGYYTYKPPNTCSYNSRMLEEGKYILVDKPVTKLLSRLDLIDV